MLKHLVQSENFKDAVMYLLGLAAVLLEIYAGWLFMKADIAGKIVAFVMSLF